MICGLIAERTCVACLHGVLPTATQRVSRVAYLTSALSSRQHSSRDGSLWFVFRDGTSGRSTHGGARQPVAAAPRGDVVVLDFNRATNLPCAYILFATCPLAPPQNRLEPADHGGRIEVRDPVPDRFPPKSVRSDHYGSYPAIPANAFMPSRGPRLQCEAECCRACRFGKASAHSRNCSHKGQQT